jgi:hypothetical protein
LGHYCELLRSMFFGLQIRLFDGGSLRQLATRKGFGYAPKAQDFESVLGSEGRSCDAERLRRRRTLVTRGQTDPQEDAKEAGMCLRPRGKE